MLDVDGWIFFFEYNTHGSVEHAVDVTAKRRLV